MMKIEVGKTYTLNNGTQAIIEKQSHLIFSGRTIEKLTRYLEWDLNGGCLGSIDPGFNIRRSIPPENSPVDHPDHYGGADNPYEAIKVIEAWGLGFNLGNTVKYISRAEKKGNRKEDLEKAMWYLKREIEKLEP